MAKFTPKQRIRAASTKIGQTFDQYKGDEIYMGFTGRGDTAKTVLVPDKPGFIFVRIPKVISGGDLTEYTEQIASSTSEFRHNVAVVVARSKSNPSVFEIKGLWPITSGRNRVQTVGESVGLHRSAHELYSPHGGHDPVFLDTLQIRNLLVTPTSPPTSSVIVGGGWYIWKDRNVHWFDGTTVDLSENVPSGSLAAYVSLWLDPTDQSIIKTVREQQIVGWNLTKEQLVVWPDEGYIPLACVRLTTLNYQVVWSDDNIANFIDMRPHQAMMPGDMLPAGHPLDPSGGYHSGTLDAVHVSLRDPSGGFLYDNMHDIMENEVMHWTGTLREIQQNYVTKAVEPRVLNFISGTFGGGFIVNYEPDGVATVTGAFSGGGGGGGATSLDGLSDVTLSSVAKGDILARDNTDWKNVNITDESVPARIGGGNVAPIAMSASTILARLSSGSIIAATVAQIKTLLAYVVADITGAANTALSNLASVAVNTDIISDADNTDSLGSASNKWLAVWSYLLAMKERTAPSTPASGDSYHYVDSNGEPRFISDLGQDSAYAFGHRAAVVLTMSTSEQAIVSKVLKQNSLGAKGQSIAEAQWAWLNNSGANRVHTTTYNFGSYSLAVASASIAASATNRWVWFLKVRTVNEATNLQKHFFEFWLPTGGIFVPETFQTNAPQMAFGSSAVDTAAGDVTQSITTKVNNATATQSTAGGGTIFGPYYGA